MANVKFVSASRVYAKGAPPAVSARNRGNSGESP